MVKEFTVRVNRGVRWSLRSLQRRHRIAGWKLSDIQAGGWPGGHHSQVLQRDRTLIQLNSKRN